MGIVRGELEEKRASTPHGGERRASSPQAPRQSFGAFDEGRIFHASLYLSPKLVGKYSSIVMGSSTRQGTCWMKPAHIGMGNYYRVKGDEGQETYSCPRGYRVKQTLD